ncbi:MAG: hypothetical protein ABF576_12310, partial [Gluconobacter japonicus]
GIDAATRRPTPCAGRRGLVLATNPLIYFLFQRRRCGGICGSGTPMRLPALATGERNVNDRCHPHG